MVQSGLGVKRKNDKVSSPRARWESCGLRGNAHGGAEELGEDATFDVQRRTVHASLLHQVAYGLELRHDLVLLLLCHRLHTEDRTRKREQGCFFFFFKPSEYRPHLNHKGWAWNV